MAAALAVEAPGRLQRYIDGCTCGRADKAAVTAIKMELEAKDSAIERLEAEIRRKDTEKDNLIHMQRDLQAQIEEIRRVLEAHATESMKLPSPETEKAALLMQTRARGIQGRQRVKHIKDEKAIVKLQAKQRGNHDRLRVDQQQKTAQMIQARARGKSTRRMIGEGMAGGETSGAEVIFKVIFVLSSFT